MVPENKGVLSMGTRRLREPAVLQIYCSSVLELLGTAIITNLTHAQWLMSLAKFTSAEWCNSTGVRLRSTLSKKSTQVYLSCKFSSP
jgi:hypothetical protein